MYVLFLLLEDFTIDDLIQQVNAFGVYYQGYSNEPFWCKTSYIFGEVKDLKDEALKSRVISKPHQMHFESKRLKTKVSFKTMPTAVIEIFVKILSLYLLVEEAVVLKFLQQSTFI